MTNQLAPIRAAMKTDQGRVRDHNEDYIVRQEPLTREDEAAFGWVYIVADGVGGADAGEFASEFAASQTLSHYLQTTEPAHFGKRLAKSMQAANTDLRKLVAERFDGRRMATTLVAAVLTNGHAYIANVGDSRGYLWHDAHLQQITKDQSLVAKLVEEGAITEEEAASHPHRNVILFSIGSEQKPKIDTFDIELTSGDKIFLCSDGLTRHVSDEEICAVLQNQDLDQAATQLIQMANDRGGQDNISVAIIDYGSPEARAEAMIPESRVAMAAANQQVAAQPSRAFLLPFTFGLAIIETVLIVFAWAKLVLPYLR